MIFSSIDFLIFFTIVLITLKLIENKAEVSKKIFLLIASYYFYAYWDWRFLSLIFINTLASYYTGYMIHHYSRNAHMRKLYLVISTVVSLAILAVFKYYNFFIDSLNTAFSLESNPLSSLNIILPLGISFYTFQTLSYTIDIYRKKIVPANLLDFSLFVVFFPQLVAGPIVRAIEFLPQLEKKIVLTFTNFKAGLALFIVGFAKKSLLADSLSIFVDATFQSPELFDSVTLICATLAYSFQIYFDFSGYSDMAIGIGLIVGFNFPKNFDYPYKSRSITEFWRRWHLTLSFWLRDYLYISLGGNRETQLRTYVNLLLTMGLGGLWHGASMNFVIWGLLHGIALAMHKLFMSFSGNDIHQYETQAFINIKLRKFIVQLLSILLTYIFVCATWILFRADSFGDSYTIFHKILTGGEGARWIHVSFYLIVPLFFIWQLIPNNNKLRAKWFNFESYSSYALCCLLTFLIILFSPTGLSPFIYFQF